MRIVVDLDGVICELKKRDSESYADLKPIKGASKKLQKLHKDGHYIIIYSARNMKTCDSNMGKIMKNVGLVTLDWLNKHNMYYDEIFFGKPNADIYIDDRALRFSNWNRITNKQLTAKGKSR